MSEAPAGRGGGADLALVAAAFVLAALPLAIAGPVPALCDYPNHLARMAVLAASGTAHANPFYREAWGLYPNLAMDLIVPPLARLIGAIPATWAFLLASEALVVGGAAALAFAVKRRIVLSGCTAALSLYAIPFAWGFVNFEFGLGLALFALAGWIGFGERPWRYALHALACVVLFAAHLFALGLYGWVLGLYELWRWRAARQPVWKLALTAALIAAPVAVLAAATPALRGGGAGATRWELASKAAWLVGIDGYSWRLSTLISIALAAVVWALARRGWLRLTGAGPWIAAGLLLLFLVMPHRLFDTEFVDVRVVTAAMLALPAFVVLGPMPRRAGRLALGVVLALAALELADVSEAQWRYRAEYARLFASFARLPPHARVLVGYSERGRGEGLMDYPMVHAPTMAAGFAGAFVPTLFAYPGKQPLVPRPDLMPIANPNGGDVPEAVLVAAARGAPPPAPYAFARDWPANFDALYLVGHPGPDPLPALLTPQARSARFVLYAVRRGSPQSASR